MLERTVCAKCNRSERHVVHIVLIGEIDLAIEGVYSSVPLARKSNPLPSGKPWIKGLNNGLSGESFKMIVTRCLDCSYNRKG